MHSKARPVFYLQSFCKSRCCQSRLLFTAMKILLMPAAAKRELEKFAATLPEGDTLPQPTSADSSEPISQVPGIVYKNPAGQSQPATVPMHGSTHSGFQGGG